MNTDRHPTSTTFGTSSGGPARWEGACLYLAANPGSAKDDKEPLVPQQGTAIRRFIEAHRASPGSTGERGTSGMATCSVAAVACPSRTL
jgi:hypothetical protein